MDRRGKPAVFVKQRRRLSQATTLRKAPIIPAKHPPGEHCVARATQQVAQQLHTPRQQLLLLPWRPLPATQAAQECKAEQRTAAWPLAGIAAHEDGMACVQPITCALKSTHRSTLLTRQSISSRMVLTHAHQVAHPVCSSYPAVWVGRQTRNETRQST